MAKGKDGKIYIAYTSNIFGKSEIRMVTTSESEIDKASSSLVAEPATIATILPAGKVAARADAELKTFQASR